MKRIYYAVFDTNVLVSALLTKRVDSPTVQLLDYVFDGQIILLYNLSEIKETSAFLETISDTSKSLFGLVMFILFSVSAVKYP